MMKKSCNSFEVEKTDKQKEAMALIAQLETILLEGGGRSGKTFIALYGIIIRCIKVPGSRHLVARFRFSHIKQAIGYDTMPKLIELCGLKKKIKLNKSDWFYEFSNGSTIWLGGLDDKERLEKILGNEYSTIFLNEASQLSFAAYEIIITRLNPSPGLNAKMIIDYNPPSIQHWGYKMFHKGEYPDGRKLPKEGFGKILMNPKDNPHLGKGYIERLSLLSEAKRRRFLEGQYSLDSGSLWNRAWIQYKEEIPTDIWRIVIGVDPSGTEDGDEIGIVVCGQYGEEYIVLDDFSCHGSPAHWASEVAAAWNKWGADLIVAEKNYGGDMVKYTIENAQPTLNVKLVTSSRGKIVRAEPISVLYEHKKVRHRTLFNDLEDEMCIYEPGVEKSPNRMDAMVFAMTELCGEGISMLDVT